MRAKSISDVELDISMFISFICGRNLILLEEEEYRLMKLMNVVAEEFRHGAVSLQGDVML